jgi:hypothetical protein
MEPGQPCERQLPPWAEYLCNPYRSAINPNRQFIGARGIAANELQRVAEEIRKNIPEPFTSIALKALKVLQLAEHAVANDCEALCLADRMACISFTFIEAMSVKHPKGAATAKQVQTCCRQLDKVNGEAIVLLLGFQADGTDFKRLSDIERFKATYRMYVPDRIGAFVNVHKNLTAVVKEATLIFSLRDPERFDAPRPEDIWDFAGSDARHTVAKVEPLRSAMDANTNTDLDLLKALVQPNMTVTTGAMPSADKVRRLFEKINDWSRTTTRTDALAVLKTMLEEVKAVDLHPFDDLGLAALKVVELAQNATVHKGVCFLLGASVAYINFIVLELAGKNCTDAIRQCASDLTAVIRSAATLLQSSQRGHFSRAEGIKAICGDYRYSAETAELFAAIHDALTLHCKEHFTLLNALDGTPSPDDMRKTMRDEMVHIADLLSLEQEQSVSNELQQLEALLDSPTFKILPPRQPELNPCDVTIDKTKVLGRGARSVVYAGILFGRADVVVKVAVCTAQDNTLAKVEDEIRRANHSRHRNVAHVFGIVMLENYTVGVVMERLGVSLENTKVPDSSMRMKYTLDIIAGMEHTHSVDPVMPFDLDPANILLTQDGGSVKIVAFKVTHAVVQRLGYFCARRTVPFMAPEFITDRSLSAPCNVYAFAVVVAELWTGTVARNDVKATSMADNVKFERRPFSPCELSAKGVPASIIALIVACWAQEPERRPTFTQLSKIRTIPNFHLAPQEAWPSFLRASSSGLL